jgi:DHA2 family multidrug resistance protein-like MFS transporter
MAPRRGHRGGIAIGAEFVRRQKTLADPLIDLQLFRAKAFSASLATYTLGTFVAFGAYVFIAQYLQLVLGLTPFSAGLWTVPSMLAFIAASMVVPSIVRRVRPAYVMSGGLILASSGFALLTRVEGPSALAVLVAGSVIYSFGISPVIILATDLIVGSAPVERAGAASAISETSSELGGALGIALLGSLGTAIYRLHVADSFPSGIPHQAAQSARDTLGGAVSSAELLPEPLGLALLESARHAFTLSFVAAAGVNAALALATAILAAVVLRGVPGAPCVTIENPAGHPDNGRARADAVDS